MEEFRWATIERDSSNPTDSTIDENWSADAECVEVYGYIKFKSEVNLPTSISGHIFVSSSS
jgi:hypothetical protein